jgi:hypothetical protein
VLLRGTVRFVPQDLGHLIGQPDFEQARGVLMELCGCTADKALTIVIAVAKTLGVSTEAGVSVLRAAPLHPDLRAFVLRYCQQ